MGGVIAQEEIGKDPLQWYMAKYQFSQVLRSQSSLRMTYGFYCGAGRLAATRQDAPQTNQV